MWQEYYDPQVAAHNRYAVAGLGAVEARRAYAQARAASADRLVSVRTRRTLTGTAVVAAVAATVVACLPSRYDTAPTAPAPAQIAPAAPQLPLLPPVAGSGAGSSTAG
jgi:hypothetical protein